MKDMRRALRGLYLPTSGAEFAKRFTGVSKVIGGSTASGSRHGAIGRALADLMTYEIGPATGPVIELGPGTGVFTRKLLARGVTPEDLTLVEYGSDFARFLRSRFPDTYVIQMDAGSLKNIEFDSRQSVGTVVSGLRLLSMPPRKVMAILPDATPHPRQARPQGEYRRKDSAERSTRQRLSHHAPSAGVASRSMTVTPRQSTNSGRRHQSRMWRETVGVIRKLCGI